MTTTFLWDQHQVGDAGFRGENDFNVFWKLNGNDPWSFQPVVKGSKLCDVRVEIIRKHLRGRPGFIRTDYADALRPVRSAAAQQITGVVHGVTSGGSLYLQEEIREEA